MIKRLLVFMIAGFISLLSINGQGNLPRLNKDNIKEVVAAMTLEEKAKLVVGQGMSFGGPPPGGGAAVGETQDKVPGAAGTTFGVERLGIPSIVVADGPAGLRISPIRGGDSTKTYYCTAFPVGTLLASTWDVDLVKSVGNAMGNELLEYGVDILLAPALNIHRNPLTGRNFEYYSEDPLISGKIASAMVNGVQANGVGTSVKHFVANNAETNRTSLNTIVTARALREIYLRGFEIAVKESDPWTVMSSYNLINGIYTSQNPELLTDILRTDWGYKGFVMTDWFGGDDPVAQMNAGNDLVMPGNPDQSVTIMEAVNNGSLKEEVLDLNVERILNIVVQTPGFRNYRYSNTPDLKAHALVARAVGAEGMVLLENNGTLPMSGSDGNLAIFGNTSYEIIVGGTGSGDVNEAYSISLIEGLNNAGFSIDLALGEQYQSYIDSVKASRPQRSGFLGGFGPREPIPEMEMNVQAIKEVEAKTSFALITLGRNSGEGGDRSVEDFYLSETELSLVRNVSEVYHAAGKKVVVVLNIGGVIETASWKDLPDAILLAWQPGQETGNAIADVLTGKINPSGKLASTFPVKYEDNPTAATFPGEELPVEEPEGDSERPSFMRSRPAVITYEDDIYVGYRYYDAFGVKPSYEFGYGLSYTDFSYGKATLSSKKFSDEINISVEITNTGKVAGKEVVQLYLSAPAGSINKPVKELKGFVKTRLLEPGESQVITFTLDPRSLSSFDTGTSSWIAEPGKYSVQVGTSSRDIRQKATFKLKNQLNAGQMTTSMIPSEEIHVLTR